MTRASPAPDPVVLRSGAAASGWLLALGSLGWLLMLRAFGRDPTRAFHSYLAAYAFALSLVLGSMGFVMIAHAANATWPVAVRRVAEAVVGAMPLLALLFAPVLFGFLQLYPWAHPSAYSGLVKEALEHRQPFMNPTFFGVRAVLYLLLWSLVAWLLRRWSLAMDRGESVQRRSRQLRRLSYAGLPLVSLTTGFAAFDWLMSLSPDFSSTMFGALWIAICLFGGLACTIVLVVLAQRRAALTSTGPAHFHALGRLLLAFLIFLGYTAFFQFLLCWIGNLPSEAEWYIVRAHGPYRWVSAFLVLGHFFLPLAALLSYRLKRRSGQLAIVALFCLLAQYLHIHWLVTPNSAESGFTWLDIVALVSVLGLTGGVGLWLQRGLSLAAVADPRFAEALLYDSR